MQGSNGEIYEGEARALVSCAFIVQHRLSCFYGYLGLADQYVCFIGTRILPFDTLSSRYTSLHYSSKRGGTFIIPIKSYLYSKPEISCVS